MSDAPKKDDDTKKEIDALKQEIAELKSALSGKEDKPPPKKEFVPEHREPIDWTARMSMPRSAIEAMVAAEPKGFMAGVVHDNRAPTGRPGMIPNQPPSGGGPVAGDGKGFAREIPIGPPPGIDLIDRAVNAALPHGPEWGKKK
jgi:hypothetical protein